MTPYSWPAPNGFPEVNGAWASAGRALDSLNVQRGLAQQWWPTVQARFPADSVWLPKLPARFDSVVDHMCRELLGEPADARLKDGIALRTGIPLTRRVTADDLDNHTRQILMVLLGSPAHMTR
jgi:hypothetical protein